MGPANCLLRLPQATEFTESCRLTRAPLWTVIPSKHKHRVTLEEGLHKMLLKKAIVRLDPSTIGPGFYSSLFLVEKRSGGWRPILNLKRLNEGVKRPKFMMDTLQSVLNTLGADIQRQGAWSVGSFLGFAGRLLSRSCRSKGHEVSPLRLRRRYLRVSGPTVQPVNRSQNLYASGQSGWSFSQDIRNKCIPISRRLARGLRDIPAGPQLPGHGLLGNSEGLVHSEQGEIRLGSVPVSSISGVFARLGPPPGVPVRGSVAATHPSCSEVTSEPGETLEVVVWPSGQHDSAGARSPTTHSSPPVLCTGEVGHVHAGVHFGVSDSGCPGDPHLTSGVPFSDPVPEMTIVTDASSYRWGGHLGDRTASGTWQLQEKLRHINWLELQAHAAAFSAAAEGHSGGGAVGQHDDSVLHQQAGRNTLSVAVQTSPGLVGVVRRAPDHNIGGASCGGEQCPSRCPVEGQLLPDGVDPSQADFRVPVAGVGASVCGHVCLGEECPIPGVLLPGIGPPGQRVERTDHELGHGPRLCVPSDRADSAGAEETPPAPVRDDRPGRSILAQPDLVPTDDESPGRSAQGNPGPVESPEELGDTRVLPGARETQVDCVEALRRSILAQGFSDKVADTAAKGRH